MRFLRWGEAHKQNLICKITNGACLVDNCITHNANSNKKNFLNVNQTFVPFKKKKKEKTTSSYLFFSTKLCLVNINTYHFSVLI